MKNDISVEERKIWKLVLLSSHSHWSLDCKRSRARSRTRFVQLLFISHYILYVVVRKECDFDIVPSSLFALFLSSQFCFYHFRLFLFFLFFFLLIKLKRFFFFSFILSCKNISLFIKMELRFMIEIEKKTTKTQEKKLEQ